MTVNSIYLKNKKIRYYFQYKNVKNINLRIKYDGTIYVSANRCIPQKSIEEFILSKSDFILGALQECKRKSETPYKQYFTEDEIRNVICELCEKSYHYFEKKGIKYPQIKFRKMVSRWGSCHIGKGVLTFNTNLMYADTDCIEYVVLHEFTHFLHPNHSDEFYHELSMVCPEWKKYRKELNNIYIRR